MSGNGSSERKKGIAVHFQVVNRIDSTIEKVCDAREQKKKPEPGKMGVTNSISLGKVQSQSVVVKRETG